MNTLHRRRLLQLGAQLGAQLTTVGAATLAAPWVRANTALTPLKFTLDFRISGQTAPFFLAQSKGYYKDEGLEVSIDVGSGSVASITRVASGAYELGFGDVSSLVEFQSSNAGAPLVQAVYQYYNRAPFAIIGRKDRGITSDFKSLEGKRIAAAAVESTRRAWPLVGRKLGMKPDAFEWVTTDFSQRDNVIVRGDVDGATYFHDSAVSLFQRIKPADLSVLSYASAGVSVYGNAVLASAALIAKNPKAVEGFVRATNRAMLETLADPAPAISAVKQREPLVDVAVEIERWKITALYIAASDTKTHGIGEVDPKLLQQQIDAVADLFALKAKPAAASVFNHQFMPPLAQRTWKA